MSDDKYSKFYDAVYTQDQEPAPAHGWIQWKGTDVCIDLHCECGHHGHVDADFFYFYECPACHKKYAVGQNVRLIPLTEDQATYVETERTGFISSDVED